MKKNKRKTFKHEEQFLGTIKLEVVGLQYYDAEVRNGEKIVFEREPKNQHDSNAICVLNEDFQKIGYLCKADSFWIAPLIDDGQLFIEGVIPEAPESGDFRVPVDTKLFLTGKGKHIFKPFTQCVNVAQFIHNILLETYNRLIDSVNPSLIESVVKKLRLLVNRDALPASHLLLHLFKIKSEKLLEQKKTRLIENYQRLIHEIKVGEGLHYHNLTIFPLYSDGNGSSDPGLLLIDRGIKEKKINITEVSGEGSISQLKIVNRAKQPVIVPEGMILTGGKQDRIINITVIVAPGTEYILPVSCIEQGRWSYSTDKFQPVFMAPPSLRSEMKLYTQGYGEGQYTIHPDQDAVWHHVNMLLESAGTFSKTGSLTEFHKKIGKDTNKYLKQLELDKHAKGLVACSGTKIMGMDFFSSPEIMNDLWQRICQSYVSNLLLNKRKKTRKTPIKHVHKFISEISSSLGSVDVSSSPIPIIDIENDSCIGKIYFYKDQVCHMSILKKFG